MSGIASGEGTEGDDGAHPHPRPRHTVRFTAGPEDIDELGHVNNAVWVQWIQDIATDHWAHAARARDRADFVWVVLRHEIDYRANIAAGHSALGTTFIPGEPRGARFDRRVEFHDEGGRLLVRALTTWAMLDRATGRPQRVRAEIAAPFMGQTPGG